MRWWKRAALMAAVMMLMAGAALAEERFGLTVRDKAPLRQGPSTASAVVGQYDKNIWMAVQGEESGWYAVTAPDGETGYIGKDLIDIPSAPRANIGVVSNLGSTAYLNLRQAPHYQAEVLATYHNGVPCLLLSHANGWYHVRVEGVEGYLREEYITPQVMAWSEEIATILVPGGAALELRAGPGETYDTVGHYLSGQYVMVLKHAQGWWLVSIGGQTGYMDADFLREGVMSYADISNAGWVALSDAYAVVNNPGSTVLNLRETPTTISRVLGQYHSGERLTLLNYGLEWCRVRSEAGLEGYMMTAYLTLEGVSGEPVMTVKHPDGTFVNLRSAPSTLLGQVLLQVPDGERVTVLIPGNEWVKVQYGDTVGYMVTWFMEE